MKNMLHMFKTNTDDENEISPSEAEVFGAAGQPKTLRNVHDVKRDSGYVTDFSPASATSTSRQFRFDSDIDEDEYNLEEEMEKIDIHDEVFPDDSDNNFSTTNFDDVDNADKEVEDLFSDSGELGDFNSLAQPIDIAPLRPGAPIPTPDELPNEQENEDSDSVNGENNEITDYSISHSYHHTPWNNMNRHCRRNIFRPISRSVGTQTPSPVSQIVKDAIGTCPSSRFQPYRLARGNVVTRLRFQSESEEDGSEGPLPDVIPFQRDRSVSLPDVPALRRPSEQEVGRELRRISDEFHSSFHRVTTRRTIFHHASSFPLNFDLMAYWDSIRRYLSPVNTDSRSQQERSHQERSHPKFY